MSVSAASLPDLSIEPLEGFRAVARIRSFPPLYVDEPEDLGGRNSAPSPFDYLLLAVGGCLTASLTLCLRKKRVQAPFEMELRGTVERDGEGLLRVQRIDVQIAVSASEADRAKVEACYGIFRKYCTVSSSIARGIPVDTALRFPSLDAP